MPDEGGGDEENGESRGIEEEDICFYIVQARLDAIASPFTGKHQRGIAFDFEPHSLERDLGPLSPERKGKATEEEEEENEE